MGLVARALVPAAPGLIPALAAIARVPGYPQTVSPQLVRDASQWGQPRATAC
jgi:hypothetical protein